MNQLDKLISRLEKDKFLYIDITDTAKPNSFIATNETAVSILAKHPSIMEYLRSFIATGITEIGISAKKKNGSTFRKSEFPVIVNFSIPNQPAPQLQHTDNKVRIGGLGGGKEITLEEYAAILEKENKANKKKAKHYKKLYETATATPFIATETGKEALALGKQLLGGIMNRMENASPSLGGGKTDNNLSEEKQNFVTGTLPNINDELVKDLTSIAYLLTTNDEFKATVEPFLTQGE